MKINESKKFIEMSAAEYSQAMTYGTEEYKALREIRNDYPRFEVVIATSKKPVKSKDKQTMKAIKAHVKTYGTDEQKKAYVGPKGDVPVEFPPEPMLVFAGFTDRRLTAILSELREKGLSDISLKAVLTEYNAIWNSATLYSQLAEERAQFLKGY